MKTNDSKWGFRLAAVMIVATFYTAHTSAETTRDDSHEVPESGAEHTGHEHDDDHEDPAQQAGPNGGRVITELMPNIEFYVLPNRHVELRALDGSGKVITFGEQWIQLISGSRSKPTRLRFTPVQEVLESDVPLPKGDSVPVVLRVRKSPASAVQTIRFNVDMSDCPGCEYKEYACTCDH